MHSEALQHLSRSPESNRLALLLNSKGREEDRYQTVLSERHAEFGMTGDLKDEPSIPSFVKELILWQAPYGESAEHEGP